ncbi:aldehyde dehydrogenase family protein [Streptomyces sp. HNM1019]|uniref:aldehyde dehydrogenase family protein n=1 Tax=Streptomyces sp. HNM1019 TaxID=3424717 RepID=UPI003D77248F
MPVYPGDPRVAIAAALSVAADGVNVTHLDMGSQSEMPHGGFKKSGYGKDLSAYGFEDYTRVKHVMTAL